jgi:molybdopterin-guanine dinucleotide biosynthesis protein A
MGCDKALLVHEGRPLWQIQRDKLGGFASEVLISARAGLLEAPVIPDQTPGLGPLGGLQSVLAVARHARVVLLGVDMPEMTVTYLADLVNEATAECGIIPELDGFYQGLAAVYPKRILPLVQEILAGPDHSLQHLGRRAIAEGMMKLRAVRPGEARLFQNWNTPQDREG